MRLIGSRLRQPYAYTSRSLILAGGAAGVSAAFNTPIAGIVFAIEELSRAFIAKDTNVLLMTVVIAGLAALSINGQYFYFGQHSAVLAGSENIYAIMVGIGGGLLGGLFNSVVLDGRLLVQKLVGRKRYLLFFALGALVALLGLVSGGSSFGTGYEEARMLLDGQTVTPLFTLSKFLATIFTYLSGIPGGIFSPSLSIGAGLGRLYADLFPVIPTIAFILLGMVSYFSGVIRAPITAIVIVAEMSNDHVMLFPLMLAAVSASATSQLVCRRPFYATLASDFLPEKYKKFEDRG
jgi:H+/Cl- antiporter ClcA